MGKGQQPLICTPLVGENQKAILSELEKVIDKKPDIIEWRVDFFEKIGQLQDVITVAKTIKEMSGNIPILFTIRSHREGGQPISLSQNEIVDLYANVCRSQTVDIIDFELSNPIEHIRHLRKVSQDTQIKMIMSYHNFEFTPGQDHLMEKFMEAEAYSADIAKVAVMPKTLKDVLTLLSVTLEAKDQLNIPVITMSMGGYGSLTRMIGGVFGSAVTFAVGENSSAPGQIRIEDLKTVLRIVEKSIDAG